jgi:uncharacterized iron-regulated membrane protein
VRANAAVYKIHKWLGLLSGLVLLVVGITGSIVVFYDELDRWQYGPLTTVPVGPKELPLETRFDAARAARPDAFVYYLYFGPHRTASTADTFYYEKGREGGAILVDPYTARVLGEIADGEDWADFLLTLHFTLLLRPWGELLVALSGFTVLASGMSGLWVYQRSLLAPFRRGVRFGSGLKRISADLHLVTGIAALAFNLVLGISGAYIMLYAFNPGNFTGERERREEALPRPEIRLAADEILSRARQALPELELHGLDLPRREGGNIEVYGNVPGTPFWLGGGGSFGRSHVTMNPRTGSVLRVVDVNGNDAASRYEAALYVLHFGQFGGLPIKILYCLFGLTPGLLSVTGFVLWWKKRGVRAARARRSPGSEDEDRHSHNAERGTGEVPSARHPAFDRPEP